VDAHYDYIIKSGLIFDGKRNPRFKADIGIKNGVISKIGYLDGCNAERILNADGLNVAPGFIDLHTHYDSQIFWDSYCSSSGWHGVTTVFIGNCGFGFAPCRQSDRERAMLTMSRVEAVPLASMKAGLPWDWVSFPEFIGSIRRTKKSVNVAINVPLNPLMIWVMGLERAKAGVLPTDKEHQEMRSIVNEAMDAGAVGVSAQRFGVYSNQRDYDGTPMASDLMHDETMMAIADTLRARDSGMIQYTYSDHGPLTSDLEQRVAANERARLHIEDVSLRSGRPILFFPGEVNGAMEWTISCRDRGLRIYPQRYTALIRDLYATLNIIDTASMFDHFYSWSQATVGTVQEIKEKMSSPDVRKRICAELHHNHPAEWVYLHSSTPNAARYSGMKLRDISGSSNTEECIDTFCDIAISDDLSTDWWVPYYTSANLAAYKSIVGDQYWIPGVSDGGAHTKYLNAGNFGTLFLITYVREHGWISLEDAHYRLSGLPAHVANLASGRGTIALGAPADIVIYDYKTLSISPQEKMLDYPGNEWRVADRGIGYRWVLVNGKIAIENDRETGVSAGQVVES